MKNHALDSSFDHQRAVRLAQNLARKRRLSPVKASGRAVLAPLSASTLEAVPAINFGDHGVYRQEVWNQLLAWACRQSGADEAFVCDERGLLIAERGDDGEAIEAISSALADALARLKPEGQHGPPPRIILVSLPHKWLNTLTFQSGVGQLVIGLLAARCLGTDELETLRATFEEKFVHL